VRVGNAAVTQRQNDTYGSMVLTAAQMFWDERLPRQGDLELYRQLCVVGNEAQRAALTARCRALGVPRARGSAHVFRGDVLGRAASARHDRQRVGVDPNRASGWRGAGVLRQEVLQRGTTPRTAGSRACSTATCSTPRAWCCPRSACCAPTIRASSPPSTSSQALMKNGFIMRYSEADDFGKPRNAFLLCTFWYIDALAAVGRRDEALEIFNNVLSRRNHFGLLSEDIDPVSGELWGNFPQTYSQVGLILCAMRLSRTWEEGLWRAS
jgi:hypothetical protein